MRRLIFYIQYALQNLRGSGRWTTFAVLSVAAGVATVVALHSLGLAIGDSLMTNLRDINRGDLTLRTVSGRPWVSCWRQMGRTLHAEPSTLPNRTMQNRVKLVRLTDWVYNSANRLVAPMTEVGLTALSVEIMTNRSTPAWSAASAMARVP